MLRPALLCSALVLAALASCNRSRALQGPASLATGQHLYATLCAACHGVDGKGYAADNAPSLVNARFLESASDEFLRRSIQTGRPGTSMAAYGRTLGGPLDDGQVDQLVALLRHQGPAAKALRPVMPGNTNMGRELFRKHCESCHGLGAVRGAGVWLANPQFLASASDAFIQHAIV